MWPDEFDIAIVNNLNGLYCWIGQDDRLLCLMRLTPRAIQIMRAMSDYSPRNFLTLQLLATP